MKKVLTLLLIGSFVAVFASCGPRATENAGESDTTMMEAPAEEPMMQDEMESDTTDTLSQDTTVMQ